MLVVHIHFHLSQMPLLDQTSSDTMLEIFEREKGSMLAGTISITWRREEWWSTTRFHSFTDGKLPSVCD